MVLKTLREKLKTVELFIIDEVFMISNVTFMFIYNYVRSLIQMMVSLTENTFYFLETCCRLIGDLFPLVKKQSPFVKMSRSKIHKNLSTIGGSDLWRLFDSDELLINATKMRQHIVIYFLEYDLITDSDINVL